MSKIKKILFFKMNSPIGYVVITAVIAFLYFYRDYSSDRNYCIRQLPKDEQNLINSILNKNYSNKTTQLQVETVVDTVLKDCINKRRGF